MIILIIHKKLVLNSCLTNSSKRFIAPPPSDAAGRLWCACTPQRHDFRQRFKSVWWNGGNTDEVENLGGFLTRSWWRIEPLLGEGGMFRDVEGWWDDDGNIIVFVGAEGKKLTMWFRPSLLTFKKFTKGAAKGIKGWREVNGNKKTWTVKQNLFEAFWSPSNPTHWILLPLSKFNALKQ